MLRAAAAAGASGYLVKSDAEELLLGAEPFIVVAKYLRPRQ